MRSRNDVAVSEFVLGEFYTLLRNPVVLTHPLKAAESVEVIQAYRRHPNWMLVGFDPDSLAVHDELWSIASEKSFARRRMYDARLALSLRRQGVSEVATANIRDFEGFGSLVSGTLWQPDLGFPYRPNGWPPVRPIPSRTTTIRFA
jgi:hypothetical protein